MASIETTVQDINLASESDDNEKQEKTHISQGSNPSGSKQENNSLQDAFIKYKLKRQKELIKVKRKRKEMPNEVRLRALADPDAMWTLRMKFLEQSKKYFGVPYAKKYWKPTDPEYQSKIFLDCCGLVRRVMNDLKKDFGFKIGPWNQSYMHDSLPITYDREEDMKPGDLVFIAATYYKTTMKKQKHDLTHVEIWLGDGPKTIGSRWHKGKVQIFDSYAFNATSYHSERYIFKSIDTWLMGICRSHCPEHTWKTRAERYKPGKKSIFRVPLQTDPQPAEPLEDVEASAEDSDDDQVPTQEKPSPGTEETHLENCEIEGNLMMTNEAFSVKISERITDDEVSRDELVSSDSSAVTNGDMAELNSNGDNGTSAAPEDERPYTAESNTADDPDDHKDDNWRKLFGLQPSTDVQVLHTQESIISSVRSLQLSSSECSEESESPTEAEDLLEAKSQSDVDESTEPALAHHSFKLPVYPPL